MSDGRKYTQDIYLAEIRRLLQLMDVKRNHAQDRTQDKDTFGIFHFAQQLAYEDSIALIKRVFAEELGEEIE